MGQAAAQALDQPGPEGVELRDLRDIDENIGPAAGELFGVSDDLLEIRREAGGPRPRRTQRQSIAPCNPLQGRVAAHDANTSADSPRFIEGKVPTRRRLAKYVPNQPYLVAPGK